MTKDEEIEVMAMALWMADGAVHDPEDYNSEAKGRYRAGQRSKDMPGSWDIDDVPGIRE